MGKKMYRSAVLVTILIGLIVPAESSGLLDNIPKGLGVVSGVKESGLDDGTIVSGLKDALSIGTERAVKNVSQIDGYFGNEMIKILLPKEIQNVANILRKAGFQKQVDEFILSMNRAAEKAAPAAISFFVDAIKEMTFEDARQILNGGDTAATEYFKSKTQDKLYNAFKPIITDSMNQVGTTQAYKAMMSKYESIPFAKSTSVDLDHYVTIKALEGLFYMVGKEETKIRKDPSARATDLMKTVFGR